MKTASRTLRILGQPTGSTCGPTCLEAVYRYYGEGIGIDEIMTQVTALPAGGTLGVSLACHALARGFDVTLYTYNLHMFDPTWFGAGMAATLAPRLRAQRAEKSDPKLILATDAYLEFLDRGGTLKYEDLTPDLIQGFLQNGTPLLTGLSATFLYACARERPGLDGEDDYDDVRGEPMGHFVVLTDHDEATGDVRVADPLRDNPRSESQYYRVPMMRLIGAILLGIITYDANVIAIVPRR